MYLWTIHGLPLTKLPHPISCMRNGVYTDGMRCTYERNSTIVAEDVQGIYRRPCRSATVYVYG